METPFAPEPSIVIPSRATNDRLFMVMASPWETSIVPGFPGRSPRIEIRPPFVPDFPAVSFSVNLPHK